MEKTIIGISAFYHDSAAAIIKGDVILAAVQEERFNRIKNYSEFPIDSIKYCLSVGGYSIDEIDAFVFYDKPFLKFERLIESYLESAPYGFNSFVRAIPIWLNKKLFLKKKIIKELRKIENFDLNKIKILFSNHHLSHAASAFYCSQFEESAILTIDGVGEWATTAIHYGNGKDIRTLREIKYPNSLGLLYSSFTYFLGFKVNSGEYKVMGLAPYGDINSPQTKDFINKIERELIEIKSDGSIFLNPRFFKYSTSLKMINKNSWEKLFDLKLRNPENQITDSHCNLAIAIQVITEKIVLLMAQEAKKITNSDYLCLAGGVALNCVSNGRLIGSNLFKDIFIQPASGDSGGSLGSALAVKYLYYNDKRSVLNEPPIFNTAYLGPEYFKNDIEILNRKTKSIFHYYENEDDLIRIVVNELINKKAVGWFQGRMEFGPRALGNRSILADPRDVEMINKLNIKIKNRENFRPFAPVMLEEEASFFYDTGKPSPYMMFTSELKNENKTLSNQTHMSFTNKLNFSRSKIPAVTHVDFSSRIQTVNEIQNKRLFKLLKAFKKETDIGVLVNTSFNERGEPIVCSPGDAYNCFINTEMDVLVLENYVYFKSEQTAKGITKNNFKLD